MNGDWANDPWQRYPYRWHDAGGWTEHVSDGTHRWSDPVTNGDGPTPIDRHIEQMVETARASMQPGSIGAPPTSVAESVPSSALRPTPPIEPTPERATASRQPEPGPARTGGGAAGASVASAPTSTAQLTSATGPRSAAVGPVTAPTAVASASSVGADPLAASAGPAAQRTSGATERGAASPAERSDGRRRVPWGSIAAAAVVVIAVGALFQARGREGGLSDGSVLAADGAGTTDAPETADATAATVAAAELDTTPPASTAPETVTSTVEDAPVDTIAVASAPPGAATTLPPGTPDPVLVDQCVEFTPFAAFVQDPEMVAFWRAAGENLDSLRVACAALPPEELQRLSMRRTEMLDFMADGGATGA